MASRGWKLPQAVAPESQEGPVVCAGADRLGGEGGDCALGHLPSDRLADHRSAAGSRRR